MPSVPIFYEREISDSHRNILIAKAYSLFVFLSHKLISNNFSGVEMDFRFRKKSKQLPLMLYAICAKRVRLIAYLELYKNIRYSVDHE